jgi:hypothetical protein
MATKAQKELTQLVKLRMADDIAFLEKCIIAVWKRQTDDEQDTEDTHEENGIGFNKGDAPILSGYADKINARGPNERLREWDFKDASKRMQKYAGQVVRYLTREEIEY